MKSKKSDLLGLCLHATVVRKTEAIPHISTQNRKQPCSTPMRAGAPYPSGFQIRVVWQHQPLTWWHDAVVILQAGCKVP